MVVLAQTDLTLLLSLCGKPLPNPAGTQSLSAGESEAAPPHPPEALDHLSGEGMEILESHGQKKSGSSVHLLSERQLQSVCLCS